MKWVGLENMGATCYINSYLQTLYANVQFRRMVFALKAEDCECATAKLCVEELQKLFASMSSTSKRFLKPESFVKALQIPEHNQQDIPEFSKLLLNMLDRKCCKMQKTLKNVEGENKFTLEDLQSFIETTFRGKSSSITICQKCNYTSVKEETFEEICLPIKSMHKLSECLLN